MPDVDTRVSPSFHPDVLTTVEGYGSDTAPALLPAAEALQVVYDGLVSIHTARESSKTNPAWNETQRVLETANFADKQAERMTKIVDGAFSKLSESIGALERELSAPVASTASSPIAAEIRAHVKGLPTDERLAFLTAAIDQGDETTVSAVLGTVPYLSGIDAETKALYTRIYRERVAPAKAKTLAAMKGAQALLTARMPAFFTEMSRAVGAKPERISALRKAKSKAEEAFVLRDLGGTGGQ